MISLRLATLNELGTVYGLRDCYDMIEIASIDAHNRRLLNPPKPQ